MSRIVVYSMVMDEEERSRALVFYRIQAVLQMALAISLLGCGSLAARKTGTLEGMPYYIGAFIVGPLMFLSFLPAMTICVRGHLTQGPAENSKTVSYAIRIHQLLAVFSILGCFIGMIYTTVGGFCDDAYRCSYKIDTETNKTVAAICFVLILFALFTCLSAMYLSCTYGSYFGVRHLRDRYSVGTERSSVVEIYVNGQLASNTSHIELVQFKRKPDHVSPQSEQSQHRQQYGFEIPAYQIPIKQQGATLQKQYLTPSLNSGHINISNSTYRT